MRVSEGLSAGLPVSLPGNAVMVGRNFDIRIKLKGTLPGHLRLALAHVFFVEQELPVEIAHVDGVQIDLHEKQKQSINTTTPGGRKCNSRFRCS